MNRRLLRKRKPKGRSLYLTRPIRITNEACLICHSTPDAAPKTMIERYGTANGFGWKIDEVVGAQIVSIPMGVPVSRAETTFRLFMAALAITFIVVLLLAGELTSKQEKQSFLCGLENE